MCGARYSETLNIHQRLKLHAHINLISFYPIFWLWYCFSRLSIADDCVIGLGTRTWTSPAEHANRLAIQYTGTSTLLPFRQLPPASPTPHRRPRFFACSVSTLLWHGFVVYCGFILVSWFFFVTCC